MDANFRWFEGEKAQYRFVPYDWAFLFLFLLLRFPLQACACIPFCRSHVPFVAVSLGYHWASA